LISPAGKHPLRAASMTTLAMIAFAGNSIICRLALRDAAIDPASFTSIRLTSGALTLIAIVLVLGPGSRLRQHGSWKSAITLFVYAISFSYAYLSLSAGTGALILFGTVQGTMIGAGLLVGDRPSAVEWLGWTVAVSGLVWLLLPGIDAPSPAGSLLMAVAGITWGIYSLRGRREADALVANASNFALSLVLVAVLAMLTIDRTAVSSEGVWLAILSGAVTSGLGYVVWYRALERLSSMQAALVQLSVPAIAMAGGALLLGEILTGRLLLASTLVLGGISLALVSRRVVT
jgi:drug/metabolite transporter (DMT)-like permease